MKPDIMPLDQLTPPYLITRKLGHLPLLAKAAAIPVNNTYPMIWKDLQSSKRRL
jgi:hypothetical protein